MKIYSVAVACCAAALVVGILSGSDAHASNTGWVISQPAKNHEVEGYTSTTSVAQRHKLQFHISATTPFVSLTIFRMGYYGGAGAQRVQSFPVVRVHKEAIPKQNQETGLIQPSWPVSLSFTVPSKWKSGMYMAKAVNTDGFESYIPFIVAEDHPTAPLLFIHSDLTDQAYNQWGGASLYRGTAPALHTSHAVQVALNRPNSAQNGAGEVLLWEYPMIRFLERNGYKVTYATSSDINSHPDLLQKFKGIIVTGHDEYWTKAMFDGYEQAVARGVNMMFFSANTAYRQIRISNGIITGYKDAYKDDPAYDEDEENATTQWRDAPLNRPESVLTGAMFTTQVKKAFPYVISNPTHWVFAGTGVKKGEDVQGMVGYECDKVFSEFPKPKNVQVLSSSPVVTTKGAPDTCQSTIYKAPSGAIVFNAGTIQWSSRLDSWHSRYGESDIIEKITTNLLRATLL